MPLEPSQRVVGRRRGVARVEVARIGEAQVVGIEAACEPGFRIEPDDVDEGRRLPTCQPQSLGDRRNIGKQRADRTFHTTGTVTVGRLPGQDRRDRRQRPTRLGVGRVETNAFGSQLLERR